MVIQQNRPVICRTSAVCMVHSYCDQAGSFCLHIGLFHASAGLVFVFNLRCLEWSPAVYFVPRIIDLNLSVRRWCFLLTSHDWRLFEPNLKWLVSGYMCGLDSTWLTSDWEFGQWFFFFWWLTSDCILFITCTRFCYLPVSPVFFC